MENAPLPKNFLNKNSKIFYEQVLSLLDKNNIPYQQTDFLVRGLDYYSDTVFEFTSSQLGAQNAVLAGGRYDQLIEIIGGRLVQLLAGLVDWKDWLYSLLWNPFKNSQSLYSAQVKT